MKHKGLFRFKKLRFHLTWAFVIWMVAMAKTTVLGFYIGIPIALAGEALRIWSQAFIEKRIKLTVTGPYAYTRNPLYLANFLIGLGFVCILSNLWYLLIYQIGFFLAYRITILEEEHFLLDKYGPVYRDYCGQVPRFFPTWQPYPNRGAGHFQWRLFLKYGEHITVTAMILLMIGLYLRHQWDHGVQGHAIFHLPLFWTAGVLIFLLAIFVVHRKIAPSH